MGRERKIKSYSGYLPGARDVNCRQLCLSKYQMPVLRSNELMRNDSVDAIIGNGIVLELPIGFGSRISYGDSIFAGFCTLNVPVFLCSSTMIYYYVCR